jgi:hypothetical protein
MSTSHTCGGTYVSIARMSRFGPSEHTTITKAYASLLVYGPGCSDAIQELEEMLAYLEPYKNIPM